MHTPTPTLPLTLYTHTHRWAARGAVDHSMLQSILPPLAALVHNTVQAQQTSLQHALDTHKPVDHHLAALYGCDVGDGGVDGAGGGVRGDVGSGNGGAAGRTSGGDAGGAGAQAPMVIPQSLMLPSITSAIKVCLIVCACACVCVCL